MEPNRGLLLGGMKGDTRSLDYDSPGFACMFCYEEFAAVKT